MTFLIGLGKKPDQKLSFSLADIMEILFCWLKSLCRPETNITWIMSTVMSAIRLLRGTTLPFRHFVGCKINELLVYENGREVEPQSKKIIAYDAD